MAGAISRIATITSNVPKDCNIPQSATIKCNISQ